MRHLPCLLIVLDGTDEEVALAQEVAESEGEEDGGDAAAHEALPRLLRAELDQRGAAHEEAEHVGHDVVHDDHHDGQDVPDEALEQVLDDQVGLRHHDQEGDVRPREQRELAHVVALHQRQDEPHEADDVPTWK